MSAASRILNLSRNRLPVRGFADRSVPLELVMRVLDCACYTASAAERQPWRFVVVQDALARHRLATAAFNSRLARSAPVLVLGCARVHSHVSGHGRPSHPLDLAAATQSMVLAAADMGLAAAWITGYREDMVREVVGIPADVPVISMLALGYPDGYERLPERREREEVVAWERWDGQAAGR